MNPVLRRITPKQIVAGLAYGSGSNQTDDVLNDRRELRRLEELRAAEYSLFGGLENPMLLPEEIEGRKELVNALIDLAESGDRVRPKAPIHRPVLSTFNTSNKTALKTFLQSVDSAAMAETLLPLDSTAPAHMSSCARYPAFVELLKMQQWEQSRKGNDVPTALKHKGRIWTLMALLLLAGGESMNYEL